MQPANRLVVWERSQSKAQDGGGIHVDCVGRDDGNWGFVASGTPDVNGEVSTAFDTSGLGPSVLGFRASFEGTGPSHTGDSDSACFDLTINVISPPSVEKNFVSGPTEADHATDIDRDGLLGISPDPSPDATAPDDGVIAVGLGERQYFTFEIVLVNQPMGTVVIDTVPGEFDLDGDPVSSDETKCLVTASRAPGASQGNLPKLEPEFLTITVVDLDPTAEGDSTCTITVPVKTDGNPGHVTSDSTTPEDDSTNTWSLFEPTGCTLVSETNDPPMVDTIALNDGFKVFDPVTGDRISGPEGSLQLTPIGCDSDDDGVIDELDNCPIDGPANETQVDLLGDGCWTDPV